MRRRLIRCALIACGIAAASIGQAQNCFLWPAFGSNVYGTMSVRGTGQGTSTSGDEGYKQSTDQNVFLGMLLASPTSGACHWDNGSTGDYVGSVTVDGSIDDQVTNTVTTINGVTSCTTAITANGAGATPLVLLEASYSNESYFFTVYGFINATIANTTGTPTCTGSGTELVPWGPLLLDGNPNFTYIPLPSSSSTSVLSGTLSYSGIPELTPRESLPVDWKIAYSFSSVPDDDCKPCKDNRGSELSLQSQSLGEDIPVVGTPFHLHYESDRAAGHAGADAAAVQDALSLGGWTLSAHHALEPLLLAWCAGGACTPYATVPKALFLGDGSTRDASDVQAPASYQGNLYLTSEDGSEIYVFHNYVHTQTLRPMTGAVLYNFGYDAAGQLEKIIDANGNTITIRRDANEHPTAIVSPYGQTTTFRTDSNGYLSEVADPAGHTIRLTTSDTGLLASYTDANGHTFTFDYDTNGRLLKDSDPAGGSLTLARTAQASGYSVSETTALGVSGNYGLSFSPAAGDSAEREPASLQPGKSQAPSRPEGGQDAKSRE